MSYVPYHPDVWPSEPVDDLRPRIRALRWACAFMVYLLGIAAWVYWMKLPPAIQPPIATIALPDGTELRLVHVAFGKDSHIQPGNTFGNRIRIERGRGSSVPLHDARSGVWMAFTQFHPKRKTFGIPDLDGFEIIEEGSPYPLRPSRLDPGPGPYRVVMFEAVPRRAPTLTFQAKYGGAPLRATISNPTYTGLPDHRPAAAPGTVASPKPAPLPQELTHSGFTARFEKVTFRDWPNQAAGFPAVRAGAHYTVTHPAARAGDYSLSYEWFDLSGNRVNDTVLPWSEQVWGWRLRARETPTFPVSPERLLAFGTVTAPGPGQVISLPVPRELATDGVTDLLLVGTGTYSWSGNRLLMGNAGAVVFTSASAGVRRYGSVTESAWGVYLISTSVGQTPREARALIRVRKGGVLCTHGASGSSSSYGFRQQNYSYYKLPKGGPVAAGEEVTIEGFIPQTHTFEFLIPRPEFLPKPVK